MTSSDRDTGLCGNGPCGTGYQPVVSRGLSARECGTGVPRGACARKHPEFDAALRVLHAHHAQEIETLLRD